MRFELDQLLALAAAVDEGSFDGAARRLHVTPSAISQRIKALELGVGRVVLIRARPVRPTTAGQTILRAARQINAVIADAGRELDGENEEQPSVITLAANADSLATWLLPALARVDAPLAFDLRRADQTRTSELLRDGTVMAAVTASAQAPPGCVSQLLGAMSYRPRASPAFAERWFPHGATVAALARAPVLVFDRTDELQDRYLRQRAHSQLQPPRHFVPGSSAFVRAARLGLGWGMLPDLQVEREKELVELDPEGVINVTLYWQQWGVSSAPLERLAVAVKEQAKRALDAR